MRILVIGTVPPSRCGIAAYASQQVARLRKEGHAVTVASVDGVGGEGVWRFNLKRSADLVALTSRVRGFDRCFLHYQHDFFFDGLERRQLVTHNLLLALLFAQGVEVICHEVVYALLEGRCGAPVRFSELTKWRAAKRLWVHTAVEEMRLAALLPGAPIARRLHHQDFEKFRDVTPAAARTELGLPARGTVFLGIGFLQPHKGFDRAIEAFAALEDPDARLFIVGSARVPRPEIVAHIQRLKQLARLDARVTVIERFLSDAAFDTWLAAADVVVLPYREIWSSGVVGRAKLWGKRIVAADVGGLAGQAEAGDVLLRPGEPLADGLRRAVGRAPTTSAARPLKLAVVAPWYGADVQGGGERVVRETAERLALAGAEVEVFSTQLQGYFSDWSIDARPAEERVNGLSVHRFPVEPRDAQAFDAIARRVSEAGAADPRLGPGEQRIFFGDMLRAPALTQALRARRADFDLFLLGHYMFATTLDAAQAVGDRGVLLPFLHDEGYARLPPYGNAYRGLRGALFLSAPEASLAQRLFGLRPENCAVVGTGVAPAPTVSRFNFARRHRLLGPYLLYVGRKEDGKNFPLLLDLFRGYRATRSAAQLVLVGPGEFVPSPGDGDSIVDCGTVSEREKFEALAGAALLVQPSVLESFSLAIMESWLESRPVLVHAGCPVTRHHVEAAQGGLLFHDAQSFATAVDRLCASPPLARELGRAGRAYVARSFDWADVIQRTLAALLRLRG